VVAEFRVPSEVIYSSSGGSASSEQRSVAPPTSNQQPGSVATAPAKSRVRAIVGLLKSPRHLFTNDEHKKTRRKSRILLKKKKKNRPTSQDTATNTGHKAKP
ncbi:unnamed protein product, partial [Ectocarpus sp. 4 AP-2014]